MAEEVYVPLGIADEFDRMRADEDDPAMIDSDEALVAGGAGDFVGVGPCGAAPAAASYAMLDRMDEARTALKRVRELSPHLTIKLIEDGKAVRDAFADAVIPGLRKAGLPET